MKFWVKIVIAFCAVVVVAFGVWAFFFREKDEVQAYNKACELVDYKESLGLKEKIDDLKKLDYIGEDSSNKLTTTTDTSSDIVSLREIMLSDSIITAYDEGGVLTIYFDSYNVIERYLDDMLVELIPYIRGNASNDNYKDIKKTINEYTNDLKAFNTALDNLKVCQQSIEGTEVEMEALLGNYNSTRIKYRRCLSDGANLVCKIFNTIKSNYGTFKYDTKMALKDSLARSLVVSTAVEIKRESFFNHDLHLVIDKIDKTKKGQTIFSKEFTEYNFLSNYTVLSNKYSSEFDKALNKHNLEKKKMADNENLSDIKIDAQASLVCVLNVLGY